MFNKVLSLISHSRKCSPKTATTKRPDSSKKYSPSTSYPLVLIKLHPNSIFQIIESKQNQMYNLRISISMTINK